MKTQYLLTFQSENEFRAALQHLEKVPAYLNEAYSAFDIKDDPRFAKKDSAFNIVKFAALVGAVTGILVGYGMPWYASVLDNPLNSGGKPLNSWPVFIPLTFVLAILFSGGFSFLALLFRLRFPEPYDPVFTSESFSLREDRFYIAVSKLIDPALLHSLKAWKIEEIPS